jgi:membrane-bound serine protease (ClpP class)
MLIIVALVLLLLLPHPWNLVGFLLITVLWFGELFLWSRRLRGKPKKTGSQTLVGREAEVITSCDPLGQVRLNGEIWAARCDAGAPAGVTVRVVAIEGLTAIVESV